MLTVLPDVEHLDCFLIVIKYAEHVEELITAGWVSLGQKLWKKFGFLRIVFSQA